MTTPQQPLCHYGDVIMDAMASQITSLTIVYSTVYSGRWKKTSKLRVTGLCEGNSPVTGEFPAQMVSEMKNASIWWRHHALCQSGSRTWQFTEVTKNFPLFVSCDQTALRKPLSVRLVRPSVRPSVRLSVCLSVTPFSLCSCRHIVTKFSGVITNDRSDVHAKGHRSKVKVTEVISQLSRFLIVTPVWIHIW